MPRYSQTKTPADSPMKAFLRGFTKNEEARKAKTSELEDARKRVEQSEAIKLKYDPKKWIQKKVSDKFESGVPLTPKEQKIYDGIAGLKKDDSRKITAQDISTIDNYGVDPEYQKKGWFGQEETPESVLARKEAEKAVMDIKSKYINQLLGKTQLGKADIKNTKSQGSFSPNDEQMITDNMKAYSKSREEIIKALKSKGLLNGNS